MRYDLNMGWRFLDTPPCGPEPLEQARAFSDDALDTSAWGELDLPGDINAALVHAGRLPDPRWADNGRRCYWVSGRDWWLRCVLGPVTGDLDGRLDLVLDGIDGHADLYVNGQALGVLCNAWRPHRRDLRSLWRSEGPNVVLLRYRALEDVLGGPRVEELAGWPARRALMRKPQYTFGWDWALPLPSIGVLGGAALEVYAGPRLVDVSLQPHLDGRVDLKCEVNRAARETAYRLRLSISGHGPDLERTLEPAGRCFSYASLTIPDPQLWWPRGLGEQPLYDWRVELELAGEVLDVREGRLGLREMAILEEPFTPDAGTGISFWLQFNGQRVFCKGGNWIPLALWPADVQDEPYSFYLNKAVDAHFNMLRIWGGGIYEREIFYDLCDELGLLVWQDFMFASTGYPVDPLREEIIAEADYQIRRLRNRPCIALWCGCNEDVYSWALPDDDRDPDAMADTGAFSDGEAGWHVDRLRDDPQIYSMILRGLVSKLGLGVPYVESSPQSHDDAGNLPESGNSHLSCWKYALFECPDHPQDFRRHFEAVQSFDSEFCIQGPPSVETMQAFLPAEHLWPPDEQWTYHIQRGHRNLPHHEQTQMIAGGIFGELDSLETYVKHGQATHVEMMRAEFESARRDRPNNGGTMMWMFNDCWPTANWSIIDYYRQPKPSYYAAKRACAPVLPIVFERQGQLGFFVSNDGPRSVSLQLRYGQAHLDGTLVWEHHAETLVGQMATVEVESLARAELQLSPGDYLSVEAEMDGQLLPPVTYFPDGWRDIPWPSPDVSASLVDQQQDATGWITTLAVRADAFARLVHLSLSPEAGAAWWDDNDFDLPAHREHIVSVHTEHVLDMADIEISHWAHQPAN